MAGDEKTMAAVKAQQEKQGGVIPSRLAIGQSILIETENYMFNLTKETDTHWYLESAHPMAKTIKQIVEITSTDTATLLSMKDWVGKDMCLSLASPYGNSIITRPVTGVIVTGEGFELSLWD